MIINFPISHLFCRTDDMVDVLNQLPDVIGNGRQVVQRYTTIGLRAIATETQRLRNINKEQEKQVNIEKIQLVSNPCEWFTNIHVCLSKQ